MCDKDSYQICVYLHGRQTVIRFMFTNDREKNAYKSCVYQRGRQRQLKGLCSPS